MALNRFGLASIASMGAAAIAGTALAGAHTWDVVEVFTNADGSIQFVELHEQNGGAGEIGLANKVVSCDVSGNSFVIPANVASPASFKSLLLATQSFADLPGAPTPDYIIPADFFNVGGDTLRYGAFDTWVIGAGSIPTDCVSSFNRSGGAALNSPTNLSGETGSVDAFAGRIADINGDNVVDTADLGSLLAAFGSAGPTGDLNTDNVVDTADLGILLGVFGTSCP
ncbi:MAG: hypothetical protein H6813_02155 [Phycisphaeraceae bacterium]|nr:hypothetical protein [Phycisphaeraceae bacterium]